MSVFGRRSLTFAQYHKRAYPRLPLPRGSELMVYALGLNEEAGEVAGKIKKLYRDKGGKSDEEFEEAILKELGDVLFYVRCVANHIGYTIEDAADSSLAKIDDREKRGVLQGEGDNR